MSKKKKGFLFFICSLIPGAGEMYLGFFKQGVSVMTLFWGVIGLSTWVQIGPLIFMLPVIWFYSFFHVHNLNSLPDEEFYAVEDKYVLDINDEGLKKIFGSAIGKKAIAGGLLGIGISMILATMQSAIIDILSSFGLGENYYWIVNLTYDLPECVIAVLFIILGIDLIKSKKKELNWSMEKTIEIVENDPKVVENE